VFYKRVHLLVKRILMLSKCMVNNKKSLSEIFLILVRNERDVIKYGYWSPCKVLVILV